MLKLDVAMIPLIDYVASNNSKQLTKENYMKSPYYIPELIEDGDILFNKNSNYLKQKKQEKKNPIFKRRTAKRR